MGGDSIVAEVAGALDVATRAVEVPDFDQCVARLLDAVGAGRRSGGMAVLTPDLRMIANVCLGHRTRNSLREADGYAPSTLKRLLDRQCLILDRSGELWLTVPSTHALLSFAVALPHLDVHIAGREGPHRWPFQARTRDPFTQLGLLTGAPVLHLMEWDLDSMGWGAQRLARVNQFLESIDLQDAHGDHTPAGRTVGRAITRAFHACLPATVRAGEPSRQSDRPGLSAFIEEFTMHVDWKRNRVQSVIRIPWSRTSPLLEIADVKFGEPRPARVVVTTRSKGRVVTPSLSLRVNAPLTGRTQDLVDEAFNVMLNGVIDLRLNGIPMRGAIPHGSITGARFVRNGFLLRAVRA